MFGKNGQNYELQLENEKLKYEIEALKLKLEHSEKKCEVLEEQLKDSDKKNTERLRDENEKLKKEVENLKFKMSNNTSGLELETENKKLKAEIEIQKSENKHLKELLDTYRSMPDVQNMVNNLQSLVVPSMAELKEFSKIISDSQVEKACSAIKESSDKIERLYNHVASDYRRYSRY